MAANAWMSCHDLLWATPERLVNVFCRVQPEANADELRRLMNAARQLGLSSARLVCGLGFNPAIPDLLDVVSVAGFADYQALAQSRNTLFVADVYKQLSLDDVLAIYGRVREDARLLELMQYLMTSRLQNLERDIDSTVHAPTIERYRAEVRSVYRLGIAQLSFAEERLGRPDNGFRALVSEIQLIAETRLIPVGEIFFRADVLPEEKRKLVTRGLVPRNLVGERLNDPQVPAAERLLLERELRLMD
jgi:hypothetical protein